MGVGVHGQKGVKDTDYTVITRQYGRIGRIRLLSQSIFVALRCRCYFQRPYSRLFLCKNAVAQYTTVLILYSESVKKSIEISPKFMKDSS